MLTGVLSQFLAEAFLKNISCELDEWRGRHLIYQSRGQIFWLTAYLCLVGSTIDPSNPLLKYNSFDHWDVFVQGKCAVNRHLCSLVTVKIFCFRCQHPDGTSSPLAETGEIESSAAFDSSWRQGCREYGLGWPVSCSTTCLLCVEGWAFQKRVSKFRFGLFYA